MQYKLYIGNGDEASALIRNYVQSNSEYLHTLRCLLVEYNADSILVEYGEHTGLIFRKKQSSPHLVPYLATVGTSTGMFAYKPRNDTAEGKSIFRRLAAIEPFSESSFLLNSLGLENYIYDPESDSDLYCSSAVVVGDKICIAVPDDGKQHDIPGWLTEVSSDEFDKVLDGLVLGMLREG